MTLLISPEDYKTSDDARALADRIIEAGGLTADEVLHITIRSDGATLEVIGDGDPSREVVVPGNWTARTD